MKYRITVEPGEQSKDEVRRLFDIVWPPSQAAQSPVAHIVWADANDMRVLMRADDGLLVSHAGILFRDALWNGDAVRLGGVGGVGTHPEFRCQGLASGAVERASEELGARGVDFAALFCAPAHVPFYERLGWRSFGGEVFIQQPGDGRTPFGHCMTLALKTAAQGGVFDVCGLPW